MAKKIVTFGGGHGTAALTKDLKNEPDVEITANVAVTDQGGSSEALRKDYGIIAVGDARIVISSLIPDSELDLYNAMEYRFRPTNQAGEAGFLDGHPLGNIELAACIQYFQDPVKAIEVVMRKCGATHRVLPVSADSVVLCAEMNDGSVIEGEGLIDTRLDRDPGDTRKIVRVFSKPEARILPQVKEAVEKADVIVICSGSTHTSIGASLCIKGVAGAIQNNRNAKLVGVANLMSNHNESHSTKASEHIKASWRMLSRTFDVVVCNDGDISKSALDRYVLKQGSAPIQVDEALSKYAHEIRTDNLVAEQSDGTVRHNAKLAKIIASL